MLIPVVFISVVALAQKDPLEGRWEGTVNSLQGQAAATANFKREGEGYIGSVSGMRGNAEVALKEIKLTGDKVTAKTEFQSPQGTLIVNYEFTLEGENLKGKGEVDFGGQTFAFTFDLKRTSDTPVVASGQSQSRQQQPRPQVPQPQQKQSLNYFVGQWSFKWIGRESALGPGPREGTTTFTLNSDGKSATGITEGKSDAGSYRENAVITWDDESKVLALSERLANGIQLNGRGDWRSPIAIRFTIDPVKVKGQTIVLKRTISVVAAHSFTVTEEISEDGGPFVQLGNAIFTKVGAAASR
jgi:hypothetical protein